MRPHLNKTLPTLTRTERQGTFIEMSGKKLLPMPQFDHHVSIHQQHNDRLTSQPISATENNAVSLRLIKRNW